MRTIAGPRRGRVYIEEEADEQVQYWMFDYRWKRLLTVVDRECIARCGAESRKWPGAAGGAEVGNAVYFVSADMAVAGPSPTIWRTASSSLAPS